MKSCPHCQAQLDDAARFCGVCGNRLAAGKGAQASARAETVPASPEGSRSRPVAPAPVLAPPVSEIFASPTAGSDPYLGKTLNNRFTVEAKLGEGGFGAVYEGVQLGTQRRVALKLLHPEMTRDANVLARFRREGQVLCSLRDAHTVTTYDFDQTEDGTLFIAMELLEGRSLHEVFSSEAPIDWRRMLGIIAQMCTSLREAHEMGIVHRDLKPENIYLEPRPDTAEFVKILDFGIAKVVRGDTMGGDNPQLTATGQTLGTLEYMSPEQLMGKGLDGRSDIYGLGVVAYELLTGHLPFPDAVGPAALISAQLRQVPKPPSEANPSGGMPPEVDALVLQMLAKDRGKRFADVGQLKLACDQLLGAAVPTPAPTMTPPPGAIRTPAPVERGPGSLAPDAPTTAMQAQERPGPSTQAAIAATRSRRWLWIVLAVIVAAGTAVGVIAARGGL